MESCRLERCIDMQDFTYQLTEHEKIQAKQSYDNHCYEYSEFVEKADIERKRYKQKQVVMLQGKPRGISTYDRIGGLKY